MKINIFFGSLIIILISIITIVDKINKVDTLSTNIIYAIAITVGCFLISLKLEEL